MNSPKRNRARVLTASGLEKLRAQRRSHEVEENAGYKYSLERLGELTGLDPETVRNVVDCKGSDKRTLSRFFETFGLTLEDSDHIQAVQAWAAPPDPNFVGRDEAIADLNALVSRNARVIVIQARGGVGKTTLARKYLEQEFGSFLEFPIAKETKDIASIEGLLEEKLRQLGEEPGREFLVSIDRLKRKLQAERIGILIDNLEPALDSAGKFVEAHRRYVELLRVLSDPSVKSMTLITSRERLREADITVQHYPLRSLNVHAWEQFFQRRSINTETPALAALHNAYGGNAKAMDIISGAVLEDFSGDVEAYWQANQDDLLLERDLEDLVAKQFNRLQQLDSEAYKLLCRMGCYRYQDVPTVPIEGLFCLLWDVPESRHRRVIKSLKDRSLVDFVNEEFWLHPIIRAEAIQRLRAGLQWEITNRKAAVLWTEIVKEVETRKDALKALETYYHYIQINDVENACEVIMTERENRWNQFLWLGTSLYRLGLLQPLYFCISQIIERVENKLNCAKINHLIGVFHRITGDVSKAIEFQNKAKELSESFLQKLCEKEINDDLLFQANATIIYSLIAKGLYLIDLWEIEESISCFRNAIRLLEYKKLNIEEYTFQEITFKCLVCLAFLRSLSGSKTDTINSSDEAYDYLYSCSKSDTKIKISGVAYYFRFLGSAYKNAKKYEKALQMYSIAINDTDEREFEQNKAQALNGISAIYREKKEFEKALLYHSQSIEILNRLGAKCDLTETYYQHGLTYQSMHQMEKSKVKFEEAIQIFNSMKAPKQVERVRQSMRS